jgi:tetratricopeptide (TPR) repeat protein
VKRTVRKGRLLTVLGAFALLGVGTVLAHEVQFRRQAGLLAAQADGVAATNPASALPIYRQYLNFRPRDVEVMGRYVETLERAATKRDRDQVALIDAYEKFLLLDESQTDVRKKLIGLLMKYGSNENARMFYSNARMHLNKLKDLEGKPFETDPWLYESFAKCELGESKYQNLKKATDYLEEAVKRGAGPESQYLLAGLLRFDDKSPPALQRADEIMKVLVAERPNDPVARLASLRYWRACDQPEKAKADVEFLRASAGKAGADVLLAVANVDLQDNKLDAAKALLAKGVEEFQDDVRFKLNLTNVLIRLNQSKDAVKLLSDSLPHLRPGEPVYLQVLDKLIDLGQTQTVTAALPSLDKDEAAKPHADYVRARLALKTGDWAVALGHADACADVINRMPDFAGCGSLLQAHGHALAGNPDAQLAAATAALRQDRTLSSAKVLQGEAYERLGQYGRAAEAFRDVRTTVAGAKLSLVKAMLFDQLTREPKARSWRDLEAELAGPTLDADLTVVRAQMLVAQNQNGEAVRAVEAAVEKFPRHVGLHVARAQLRSTTANPAAGLAALDEAEKACGDAVEFRLTRASLLTRDPATATTPRLTAVGEKVDGFNANDRYRIWYALGETFVSLSRPAEAETFFRKAADLAATDLPSRIALFDLACAKPDFAKANAVAEEFRSIEGANGPTYVVCKTIAELPSLDRKKPGRAVELRRAVEAVKPRKEGWGRLYAVLGDLNEILGNADGTVENYVKAIERGDRSKALLAKTHQLLTQRRQYEQANAILARAGRLAGPTDVVKWGSAWGLATADPKAALDTLDPNSRKPGEQVLRAQLFVLIGKPQEAEAAFREALDITRGEAADIWVSFVRFLVSAGRPDDARKAYNEAKTKVKPVEGTPSVVPFALGLCLEAMGDYKGAEEKYRAALAAGGESHLPLAQLANLYQRLGRRADAESLLTTALRTESAAPNRRQFRRQLAVSKVSHATGYQFLPEAVALVEENIAEANQIEDIRAKALILAVDATRSGQAKDLLLDTAKRFPLTAEENALLARLCLAENDPAQAETYLLAATRTPNVVPEHLALLARVQSQLDKAVPAKATVDKLKLLAPASWDAAAESARLAARAGDKTTAAKTMLAHSYATDPGVSARTVAPFLEEIGCLPEAEAQFERALKETNAPTRHTYLAGYYLRHGQPQKAIDLAMAFATKPDVPVDITCRILSGAVHSRAGRKSDAAWDRSVADVRAFIKSHVEKWPNNAGVRYAEAELADAEGRYDDAIAAYEAALAIQPGNAIYENNLAFLLAVHGPANSNRPLELIESVIRKMGPAPTSLDSRAVVHTAAGRPLDAIKDLTVALQLSQNPVYRFHLAVAYDKANNPRMRDAAMTLALADKLTREKLHPKEWPTFDRLTTPAEKK